MVMKVLLTALNSKYIHSSLALRYIEKFCNKYRKKKYYITVREFSINENLDDIMAEIYKIKADLIAFSIYIWNRDLSFELAARLKKIVPGILIVMGGPEVSFDSKKIMKRRPYIDIVVKGEGELSLKELLDKLEQNKKIDLKGIKGIVYRDKDGNIIENEGRELIKDLDIIPRPYTEEELRDLKNKIIYYESSRGCPYNCSYCLSSTIKGVRSFSLARIKEDLLFYINNNVPQLKFVDRTFNYDKRRTMEIMKFLVENISNTSFHFEITADILDEGLLEFLADVPDGLFQFEIGVQSTNRKTLNLIKRKMDFFRLAENVKKLREADNIKLHLDLIAGLPAENYESFANSFNQVYSLNPHVLQLGFLKLLRGSRIREEGKKYLYQYSDLPPYEVLENKDLSYFDIIRLKGIEFMVDKYHNSGVFKNTLKYIFSNHYKSYFSFYEDLAAYFVKKGLHRKAHSRRALYDIILGFFGENMTLDPLEMDKFREILKFDFVLYHPGARLPDWAIRLSIDGFNKKRYQFLESEDNIRLFIPKFIGWRVKDILKEVGFELFKYDIMEMLSSEDFSDQNQDKTVFLFDYSNKEKPIAYNVSDFFLDK